MRIRHADPQSRSRGEAATSRDVQRTPSGDVSGEFSALACNSLDARVFLRSIHGVCARAWPTTRRVMRALLAFFASTYIVAWVCFVAAGMLSRNAGALRTTLLLLGTFAPSLVALALTARDTGAFGVRSLLGRLGRVNVPGRWYLFAVSYMAVVKLAVAVTHRIISGSWPPFGTDKWYAVLAAIVISTPVQAGEEIGWRGYALPRLAARYGLATASLIVGLFWAAWHLPLFFLPGADKYGQSFPIFVLGGIALSVAIAFLYANTGASLFLTMLMHSAINQTLGIVPSVALHAGNPFSPSASLVAYLTTAFLWIGAAYLLVRMPRHTDIGPSNTPVA